MAKPNRSASIGSPRAHLKRCQLCGALNSLRNYECFVCRWHGQFDTSQRAIDEGLEELLNECPDLESRIGRSLARPRRRIELHLPNWLLFAYVRVLGWFRRKPLEMPWE
ncbi:MAG TPA: hypothetical protein VMQ44_02435 [Candidatus Saccharimonadales bacterium]|nr:hypothetical protein [Candidatus Saccharimonadales bacterium]